MLPQPTSGQYPVSYDVSDDCRWSPLSSEMSLQRSAVAPRSVHRLLFPAKLFVSDSDDGKTTGEDDDADAKASPAFTVLLHGSLKVLGMVALAKLA